MRVFHRLGMWIAIPTVATIAGFAALIGCFAPTGQTESAEPNHPPSPPNPPRPQFAEDRDPAPVANQFDAKRAFGYLEELCQIGPRISGSEGMKKQQQLLKTHFEKLGGKVRLQTFQARQNSQRQPVEMTNLIVSWYPDRTRRVIFCGHYDTRPIADEEPDRRNWFKPFISANDGTSTAAWLMELAHHMKDFPTAVGVDFVLFDGEEYVFEKHNDKYFFGSEYFAEQYIKTRPPYRYTAAILLDLFAGRAPQFPMEMHSKFRSGALLKEIWDEAARQKMPAFRFEDGPAVQDDHLALQRAGIPAIDIIDFNYPHWHRLSDTPANCSPDSMEMVAKVLMAWLQKVK